MKFRFPLDDVKLIPCDELLPLQQAGELEEGIVLNQDEFQLDDASVARFQVTGGNEIRIQKAKNASQKDLEIYLNGSLFGAVLHQRKIISFHAGSFLFGDLGIVVCGESEVGKSTTTLAFCLNGSGFLTDEVTPVQIRDGQAFIWGVSDRLKIWDDALSSLDLSKNNLEKIWKEEEKYFFELESPKALVPLSIIFLLEIHAENELRYEVLECMEKFEALRNQVYRKEYLQEMPETEKAYLEQLTFLSGNVPLIRIRRPEILHPHELRKFLEELILFL